MPSQAQRKFERNLVDIDKLSGFHLEATRGTRRSEPTEVLNKSAIVLMTAFWEAYCEDLAAEALEHLVQSARSWELLPKALKKLVANELKEDPHGLAVWRLAGDGWRTVLTERLGRLQEERNRSLNTPKAAQIDDFFEESLGICRISTSWSWKGMSTSQAADKLDSFVTLRGDIAHRGAAAERVSRNTVEVYVNHVRRLVGKTGGHVNETVRQATGDPLWVPALYRIFANMDEAELKRITNDLNPMERQVIQLRFGTDDFKFRFSDSAEELRSLEEIAKLLGIEMDRVRQIEARIIQRAKSSGPEVA